MKSSISKSCPSLVPDAENNLEYMDSPSPPSSGHTSSENKGTEISLQCEAVKIAGYYLPCTI